MKWFILLSFLFVFCIAENCPQYPIPVPLSPNNPILSNAFSQVNTLLQNAYEQQSLPGLVCSVVYDQDIVWSNGYGKQNPFSSTSPPPTINSVVRVASITKTFTSLMLMLLRDQGVVNLDDPVKTYFPEFSVKDPYNTNKEITLRELASHTSGLQREIPCDFDSLVNCTEQEIITNISQIYLILPQYNTPHYSNLGMALLGRTLEKATEISYEEFVQKEILGPLGMTSSTFQYDSFVKENMAIGVIDGINGPQPAPIDLLGWGTPMGGLFSTASDMSSFISFLFRDNKTSGGSQLLDSSSINEFLKPVIMDNDGYSAFGTPWEFKYVSDYWVKSKAGDLPGYRSQVAIVPPIKLGVFCAAMCDCDDETQSAFTVPILEILLPAFTQALWANQPVVSIPNNADIFTGLYEYKDIYYGSSYFEIFVDQDANALMLANTDLKSAFNLMNMTQFSSTVFRVQLIQDQECRWLNDGSNLEFVYFSFENSQSNPSQFVFMGTKYRFISKNCPDCNGRKTINKGMKKKMNKWMRF